MSLSTRTTRTDIVRHKKAPVHEQKQMLSINKKTLKLPYLHMVNRNKLKIESL